MKKDKKTKRILNLEAKSRKYATQVQKYRFITLYNAKTIKDLNNKVAFYNYKLYKITNSVEYLYHAIYWLKQRDHANDQFAFNESS